MSDETDNRCEYLSGTIGAELHCAHWHAADDAEFAGDRASAECCWCGDHEDGSGSCPGPSIDEIERLRHELSIQINGCDCPKPYDECTHEEPLLRVVDRLEAENKRLGQLVAQHAARADYWTAQTGKAQEALAVGGDGAYEHVSEMLHDALAHNERLSAENERLREALRARDAPADPIEAEQSALEQGLAKLGADTPWMASVLTVLALTDAYMDEWDMVGTKGRAERRETLQKVIPPLLAKAESALIGSAAASLSETGGEADEHEAPECWTCGGERTHPVSDAMPCPRCNGTGDEPTSTGGEAT